jgi:hypothetical protein
VKNVKNKQEQEQAIKNIINKYEPTTGKLYRDILTLVSQKGAHSAKTEIRRDILDKVKGALK